MQKYWFKAKRYGYGWYPATWEGWLIMLLFLVLMLANFYRIDSSSHSVSDTLINFIPQTALLVAALWYIAHKTGEPARWRWGDDK
ncbi:hypothetical protein EXS62_00545 [Candidatus Kaiserbacteria bacterium]|nr:hypothetical protein [Candidatus Kaiserbacteria bacterium]